MFISHWLTLSGADELMAPKPKDVSKAEGSSDKNSNGVIDNSNATTAMNEEPENPLWSIVAPRQELSSTNNTNKVNDETKEDEMVTKAPPAEIFQQQRMTAVSNMIQCVHCDKMTPINSKLSSYRDDDDDAKAANERLQQALREKEQLQLSYENKLGVMKKEKRELEEEVENLKLQLEVNEMKINNEDEKSWQPTTPAASDATVANTPAMAASVPTNPETLSSSQSTDDEAADEKAYIRSLVLAAARGASNTHTAPLFVWEKRKKLFERCSAQPKKTQGSGEERSKNLKNIIKELKNDPTLVTIRSANMQPLPDGYTLLHAAVYAGNLEVVEYLLQEYVVIESPILDLNVRDMHGRTPLHICAEGGHTDVLLALARAYDDLEKILEERMKMKDDSVDDDNDVDGNLSNAMAKLDTTVNATFTSPPQQLRTRSKSKQKSRSTRPPSSSHLSPKFAGPTAPIDLSGRTPLGYAATSPIPKAKNNRAQNEKILYRSGDRSIVGERTPPRERSGGLFTPPRRVESAKKVGFHDGDTIVEGEEGAYNGTVTVGSSGLTSYLSPTPRKTAGRKATPFHNLSSPSPLKAVSEEPVSTSVPWGAAEMPGRRIDMEDAILCQYPLAVPPRPISLDEKETDVSVLGIFGVFDGHGDGGFASQSISTNLIPKLQSNPSWSLAYHEMNLGNDSCTTDTLETIFTEACYDLDDDLKHDKSKPRDGGTTAIVAIVSSRKILVANIGDSRCILVRKRSTKDSLDEGEQTSEEGCQIEVIPMSEDHKPDLPDERARIESAGLEVHMDQIPPNEDDENGQYQMISKVKKSSREMLGVARAFGDYDYKSNEDLSPSRQAVVCTPDIEVRDRVDSDDMFLILACDGIWDVMSNDEVGSFVSRGVNAATEKLAKEDQQAEADILASVGDSLLNECLEKGSTDNMSVLIVALPASGLLSFFGNASVTARALAFE